jgi:20S proteasome subunit beta 2
MANFANMEAFANLGRAPSQADDPVITVPRAGFNFDLVRRNQILHDSGLKMPKPMSTGTTIVGVVYKGGIVLGADTRATAGNVADKNCEKIHYIAPNIYCCGAGTAADTEMTTAKIASDLELLRMSTGTESRVVACMTMLKRMLYKYQGHVSAALVLGGVDATGPHLYTIYPHGSTDKLPFVTMGSGSLAAMSVFESGYKDDMTEDEAKALVQNAIRAGIFNDLGSGSNVDLAVIRSPPRKGERVVTEMFRGYETPNNQGDLRNRIKRPEASNLPIGTTVGIESTVVTPIKERVEVIPGAKSWVVTENTSNE